MCPGLLRRTLRPARQLDSSLVRDPRTDATIELRRAAGLYRERPGISSDAWGLLRGTYLSAVKAGLTPERIESLTGMSIAQLEEIVGAP
jgi:hypothetical protein